MDLFTRLPVPVVAPSPEAWWASGAAFNPGADLAPDGTLRLVVRGVPAGYRRVETPPGPDGQPGFPYRDYISHLGLATRQPDGTFALDAEPLLSPASEVDRWGVEDARVTRLNGTIYLTYTALAEPAHAADAGVGIALASTADWQTVERHGRIGPPSRDKDAVLFSELVGGRVALLHRVEPDIQVAYFEDEGHLRNPGADYWERHLAHLDRHTLLRPEQPWEGTKIGAGPPPILTDEGWLLVTHGVDANHVYRAGLVLLDRDTLQVISRTRGPVFEPRLAFEREGDIPNVVFPTGAVVEGDDLTLFYGAADACVGQASAPLADVLARLHDDRSDGPPPPRVLGPPAVPVDRLHGGRPILESVADHAWESGVVLNPAAVLVDDPAELAGLAETWGLDADEREVLAEGACVMVYRAQGMAYPRETPAGPLAASSLGLAVFTPDMRLVRRWPDPVIAPDAPFHDLGAEDPRCTRVGETYHLVYTGYTSAGRAPGTAGRVQLCLATTTDFVAWDLRGPLASDGAQGVNAVDDKNGALFPEPVDGTWYLWHRPMAGPGAMAMHLASAPSPQGPWRSRGPVLASDRFAGWASSWVGAAGPPVALGGGRFLALTHHGHRDAAGQRFYHLSAALVAPAADVPVRARLAPLLLPQGDAERLGDPALGVDDVVFSCAAVVVGDRLVVPYAGADSRIFAASAPLATLVAALGRRERQR
ncbi:glycosidase [Rubrivirga sp. IMCC45206]|uniref:glycoside hydrolase family 130 protein n=1 Tax=Rubrivirga sp. IMCC45206 TaxID=3391614 RepID=UPI00399018C7